MPHAVSGSPIMIADNRNQFPRSRFTQYQFTTMNRGWLPGSFWLMYVIHIFLEKSSDWSHQFQFLHHISKFFIQQNTTSINITTWTLILVIWVFVNIHYRFLPPVMIVITNHVQLHLVVKCTNHGSIVICGTCHTACHPLVQQCITLLNHASVIMSNKSASETSNHNQ